jgi:very-short-patch-repair endonuclease
MRLFLYWILWVCLVMFAFSLGDSGLLHKLFLALLALLFLVLLALTLESVIRNIWRSFVGRFRYAARERALRKRDATTESPLERHLARALDDAGINYVREYPVSRIHVDFALVDAKLAIECDGIRYHGTADARRRDARRDEFLRSKGWRILRFSGDQIRYDIGACIRKIKRNI